MGGGGRGGSQAETHATTPCMRRARGRRHSTFVYSWIMVYPLPVRYPLCNRQQISKASTEMKSLFSCVPYLSLRGMAVLERKGH